MTSINSLHSDLIVAKTLVYDICGLKFSNPTIHTESKEYGACSFKLNDKSIEHRVSKITPTKAGQFVTIWKRNKNGITEPYHFSDNLDFIIITSRCHDKIGQFIFPKTILAEKGIISKDGKIGKRGIRVYPPWNMTTNKQAEKTQRWQINYFHFIKNNDLVNLDLIQNLF